MYQTVNPATGQSVASFPALNDAEVEGVLSASTEAYASWRKAPLKDRASVLKRAAELHRERADELAALLTLEVGKPIAEARGEVALVANIYEYYADHAEEFLDDEQLSIAGPGEAIVRTEPIGPIVGVMPWNFPYYQVARFAAPNVVLGNTVIVKHSRNCPQSALAIESILNEAGVPEGVYINAFATSGQIAAMVADPRVRGVSLTGSEMAGSAVAEVAGRHMKKFVLELGGSDPFIVLADADLDKAVSDAVAGRLYNAGQACTASKRFIVEDGVYDEFLSRFAEAMRAVQPDDPMELGTRLGPLASRAAAEELAEIVDDAILHGATAIAGDTPGREGAFFPPTVLTGVVPGTRAYSEELFGPVAVVHRASSASDAVEIANDSAYGLAASVYTTDEAAAREIAAQLEAGMVWINSVSRSAPDLPFGGVKLSGVGRELSRFGINEFANKKLVRIPKPSAGAAT
ncbi:NAD-dependent succinate-semialdehyde dehydrogenase [Sinomonas notoginsengisoli]|uniref:NAD-dependent succinate-semialdehyde dehydrogenase n=1 Tax=Sinomonas notoginsengisoli TaxID=1457311 RepID=UPI0022A66AFD|nr:NAD-dependent succinate-semialdehyde dehydrogenase [Sinomonas notoginsengisoli]